MDFHRLHYHNRTQRRQQQLGRSKPKPEFERAPDAGHNR
jgi:hypothetical protein